MKLFPSLLMLSLLTLFFSTSCDKRDPVIQNEEELITTLVYTLTPVGGGTSARFFFQDLDGDGGNDPIITADDLTVNTTYNGSLSLLNELETPPGNINTEILAEATDHQFFFGQTVNGISLAYTDMDADGNPVGLSTILTTSASESGDFTIILRHEPDKNAFGVAQGDIEGAGGATDIEVTFAIDVQ